MKEALTVLTCTALLAACGTIMPVPVKRQYSGREAEAAANGALEQITRKKDETYHYDKNGKPVEQPAADGYFRKVLGKAAGGKWVVQDFYGSGQKQTNPVLIPRSADVKDFANPKIDGLANWYGKDGVLLQSGYLHQGQGAVNIYRPDGSVWAFSDITKMLGTFVIYHENGQKAIEYDNHQPGQTLIRYYDKTGKPLAQTDSRNPVPATRGNDGFADVQNEYYRFKQFARQHAGVLIVDPAMLK